MFFPFRPLFLKKHKTGLYEVRIVTLGVLKYTNMAIQTRSNDQNWNQNVGLIDFQLVVQLVWQMSK